MFPRKSSSVVSLRRERDRAAAASSAPSAYVPPVVFPGLAPQLVVPPAPRTRSRSRTGPSKWDPGVPQLTFSNSSSTPNTDTPPCTPDDYHPAYDSFDHFSVVVAAPVSGVETMDALVEGMNGGDIITPRSSARHGLGPIPNHHPLYQPPLPTPPPGIVLGTAKPRKAPQKNISPDSTDDEDDEDDYYTPNSSRSRRRRQRPSSSRTVSNSTITASSYAIFAHQDSDLESLHSHSHRRTTSKDMHRHALTHSRRPSGSDSPSPYPGQPSREPARPHTPSSVENRKVFVPSISEIVRNFAPPSVHRTRPYIARSSSLYTPSSHGHSSVLDDPESEPEIQTRAAASPGVEEEPEAEFLSRSSIDSVADEVQRTIRNQNQIRPHPRSLPPPTPTTTFKNRYSTISDNASSIYSPRSDPGTTPSVYSFSAPSSYFASSPLDSTFLHSNMTKTTASQAVAQYLRSSRLTRLLKLTRSPHASADNPLTVSLSDLGSATGFPVVIFLGLGCVRHIMGLYDEMAQCMGLRLITIDRWGLGRTEPRSKSAKGIIQWAAAVEEVLDLLRIEKCSVMAHSAGAPYALSFANRVASRIRGDICLLAPWVGGSENNGYKWLKYVPNSILKTAQAAEWKIQAWMIGKPPTLTYEGIGFTLPVVSKHSSARSSPVPNGNVSIVYPSASESRPRPSIGSSSLSEYDDLRDFEGQFGSRSTLGLPPPGKPQDGGVQFKRKPSKGIFERLKGSPSSSSQNQDKEKEKEKPISAASSSTRKLRALTSMGSLKNRGQGHGSRKSEPSSPQLPPALRIDVGLGLEDLSWMHTIPVQPDNHTPRVVSNGSWGSGSGSGSVSNPRSSGRRSISFTSSVHGASLGPPPSPTSVFSSSPGPVAGGPSVSSVALQSSEANFQAQLGNALIAASHAESSKGTTNDLLQILNHENHSWGFSYANYPHRVRVWYGDKDEKIAENAVRWMEKTMGPDRCSVKVVKGADHGLMYRSGAVVDVLEWIQSAWRDDTAFSELRRR